MAAKAAPDASHCEVRHLTTPRYDYHVLLLLSGTMQSPCRAVGFKEERNFGDRAEMTPV